MLLIKKSVFFCLILSLLFSSCVNTRKVMDSWVGSSQQRLIESWGPPARIAANGGDGQVLIYSVQMYNSFANVNMYKNTMFYTRQDGTIYHWLVQMGTVPPQQINLTVYRY
jgi:hypothetical protein